MQPTIPSSGPLPLQLLPRAQLPSFTHPNRAGKPSGFALSKTSFGQSTSGNKTNVRPSSLSALHPTTWHTKPTCLGTTCGPAHPESPLSALLGVSCHSRTSGDRKGRSEHPLCSAQAFVHSSSAPLPKLRGLPSRQQCSCNSALTQIILCIQAGVLCGTHQAHSTLFSANKDT